MSAAQPQPESNSAGDGIDTWICRIPRTMLHRLANNAQLPEQGRVLMAMIAELYSHRDGGEASVNASKLSRSLALNRRSVRRALSYLELAGVVAAIEAKPGQMKRFRLTGGAHVAPGVSDRHKQTESAPPPDLNVRHLPGAHVAPPPGAHVAPPLKEIERSKENARARANGEQVPDENGEAPLPRGVLVDRFKGLAGVYNGLGREATQ